MTALDPRLPSALDEGVLDDDEIDIRPAPAVTEKDRDTLIRRLCDLVLLPPGQLMPQERNLLDSVLVLMLNRLDASHRHRLAKRLAQMSEVPPGLTLALAHDEIEIAMPLLEEGLGLQNSELVQIVQGASVAHRERIAVRRALSSPVTDALIVQALENDETQVLKSLLANEGASLSARSVEMLVYKSSSRPELQAPLLLRPEMTARLAHTMFWWAPSALRLQIVARHSMDRRTLQDKILDQGLEKLIESTSHDPVMKDALSLVRPVPRLDEEDLTSLLGLLARGWTGEFMDALSVAARIRPETVFKIVDDRSGEPVAVLGKALGFNRASFDRFARGTGELRRGPAASEQEIDEVVELFDTLSRDRADMVLRYWDQSIARGEPPVTSNS